jgi:hypothetical protein
MSWTEDVAFAAEDLTGVTGLAEEREEVFCRDWIKLT